MWVLSFIFLLVISNGFVEAYTPPNLVGARFSHGELFRSLKEIHQKNFRANREYVNGTAALFPQLVNHSDPEGPVFNQRYWVDYSAWNGSDKAMLYIGGEAPAISSPDGYPGMYGHQRNMLLFTLENRYYGGSFPFPLTEKEKLTKYLSVDIALDDLYYFQRFVEDKLIGKKLRWLIVGGSYAGALSVWFKVKYPTSALAIWSSSGVVEPRLNFYAFDGHVNSEIPRECAKSVHIVQSLFSKMWENSTTRLEFLDRYDIPYYFEKSEVSSMLADAVSGAVQYGRKWEMCNMIVDQNNIDPLGQFLKMIIRLYGRGFTSNCGYSTQCLTNTSMSNHWTGCGYAWIFQTCKELAYFQVGYHNSLRLPDVSTEFFVNQCRAVFGDTIFPDVFQFNSKWGGKKPNAGNVVALQGSDDPWTEVGVTKTFKSNYQAFVARCEGCGHCGDLSYPNPADHSSLQEQRERLAYYLDIWMSGEPTSYMLILHHNFSTFSLHHKEELVKAVQNDLHDFFDHTADIQNFTIDNLSRTFTINFVIYVNSLNKDEVSSTIIKLRNMSSWLLHTQKVLDSIGDKGQVVVQFFEQSSPLKPSEESSFSFDLTVALTSFIFIFITVTNMLIFVYKLYKKKNNVQ
ncbi:serine carboxypeptidase S28 [Trypanosoma theileri]|uniref:Serine carboxypeptidase S28 n=1 Tax=Trypanosoma theileri TaxID=67003 RepID=A0A1X0NUG3_9TRYP|nr:serine carboxypeptidase S28 [Trypanosoma theileri]ORC88251.1 serine carboxypeptidase S28 [Trypanosoma theileri]